MAGRAELHECDGGRVDEEREQEQTQLAVALRLRHPDAAAP
jgi:hypothetical protein